MLRTQTEVKPTRWQTGGLEGAALRSLDLAFERQEDKVESLHATNPTAVSTSNKKNSRSAKVSEREIGTTAAEEATSNHQEAAVTAKKKTAVKKICLKVGVQGCRGASAGPSQ